MPVDSTTEPYRDASQPVDERVEDLIERMTLPEKVAQLGCVWITSLVHSDRFDADAAAARIPDGIGQVTRIGASTGLRPAASAALMNEIQRVAVERTRLGIPVVVHEESVGGFCAREATVFPQGIGLASSWDPDLVRRVATVIREQMLAVGARHTLAPVLDVARDPRWGRVEETYGEDPVLAGTIGTAYVRGMQSDDLGTGVVATGKHFLGYAIAEGGLNWAPVQLGPRELREVYAEPFAAAIRDAGLASIMNSYSSVDGLPCGGAAAILTGLLRDELGFDGLVVADYGTVALLETHHRTASDKASAAAQALNAGLDVELPALDCFASLPDALDRGLVTMPVIDQAVRRVLRCKFRLGLFEQPYVDAEAAAGAYQTVAQRALTREAATASLVLLSNPSGVLPLAAGLRRIAVIGPGADDERLLQGDYHYPAHLEIVYEKQADDTSGTALDGSTGTQFLPESGGAFQAGPYYTPHITPLAGIRSRAGDGVEVVHVRGCDVSSNEGAEIDEAAAAAAAAGGAIGAASTEHRRRSARRNEP